MLGLTDPTRVGSLGLTLLCLCWARPAGTAAQVGGIGVTDVHVCADCHGSHATGQAQSGLVRVGQSELRAQAPGINSASERCLRCHGTRGERMQAQSDRPIPGGGGALLGGSLADDHPLGARGSLLMDLTPGPFDVIRRGDGDAFPLLATLPPGGSIECTSCHDPHDPGQVTQQNYAQDETCLRCHDRARDQGEHGIVYCGSCHQMHATPDLQSFVREADPDYLCGACHRGAPAPLNPGIVPIPAPPVHNDPADTRCSTCHKIH